MCAYFQSHLRAFSLLVLRSATISKLLATERTVVIVERSDAHGSFRCSSVSDSSVKALICYGTEAAIGLRLASNRRTHMYETEYKSKLISPRTRSS